MSSVRENNIAIISSHCNMSNCHIFICLFPFLLAVDGSYELNPGLGTYSPTELHTNFLGDCLKQLVCPRGRTICMSESHSRQNGGYNQYIYSQVRLDPCLNPKCS